MNESNVIDLSEDEKILLKQTIGKEISKIQTSDFTNFYSDTIWIICLDLCDSYLSIEREDMVAMLFDEPEDGGKFKVSKIDDVSMYSKYFKTINRVVRGVSIVMNHVRYEISQYALTYTKAIIFHFDDCNLVLENWGTFSLAGFVVRLESLDAENFGLQDDLKFEWYDPEESEEIPVFTQNIEKL